jgi:hypothetical protein
MGRSQVFLVIGLSLTMAGWSGPAVAGPNAGGVVVLHANPNLVYSASTSSYCGQSGLTSCEQAQFSVNRTDPVVFHALAAFPDGASPSLIGVVFGITYDESVLRVIGHGACGDVEYTDPGWPGANTAGYVGWNVPQTAHLTEFYWFAAYDYSATPTTFRLRSDPEQGGFFLNLVNPTDPDPIADYGALGFFTSGSNPCLPSAAGVPEREGRDAPLALSVGPQPWVAGRAQEITLTVARAGRCEVALYDIAGRKVASVYDGPVGAGTIHLSCPAENDPPHTGIYFVIARQNREVARQKVLLID